jgi:hypothetical protein
MMNLVVPYTDERCISREDCLSALCTFSHWENRDNTDKRMWASPRSSPAGGVKGGASVETTGAARIIAEMTPGG